MQDLISTLFTRANITLALSIFGAFGTLVTFISSHITKRKNLKIKINATNHNSILQRMIVNITFENHSHLPIAVTSISAIIDGEEFKCMPYPHYVGEYSYRSGNEVVERIFTHNLELPSDISQLSAVSGYVLFDVTLDILEKLSTPVILLIHSTRGKVQKIQLQLDQIEYF